MTERNIYKDNLGKIIKRHRKQWGMGKFKFARLIGEEFDFVEELEKGKIKNVNLSLMYRIAEVLQVSVYEFLKEDVTDRKLLERLD